MIDLHSHLIPAVDDGAADLTESEAALGRLTADGMRAIVVTPHVHASTLLREEEAEAVRQRIDRGWEELVPLARERFPEVRLERGAELMLDHPAPGLQRDWIRLAGTRFVLVEFPGLMIPTRVLEALAAIVRSGFTPVISHPERYRNAGPTCTEAVEWKQAGVRLQVNCGSLIGQYGSEVAGRAWGLLAAGAVDYLASDYHARGRSPVAECRRVIQEEGGEEQSTLLLCTNPARLLDGLDPLAVPPLPARDSGWRRLVRLGAAWKWWTPGLPRHRRPGAAGSPPE